jgi:hypothetical protein
MGQDPPHLSSGAAVVRPSLRFLAIAVVGWAGFRAATLGTLPGAEMFAIRPSQAKPPPAIVETHFPELAPPVQPAQPMAQAALPYGYDGAVMMPAGYAGAYPRPLIIPVYYQYPGAVSAPVPPASYTPILPMPSPQYYPAAPSPDDWPITSMAAASIPVQPSAPATAAGQGTPTISLPAKLDRVQLSMWAMLRQQQNGIAAPTSLASGGTLGGSQAGARLFYNVTPQLAAVLRTSSDVGRRGGEVAAGVRVQPLRSLPVWVTAERRQALGKYGGGRNAFAVFAESGLYGQPMPLEFILDGYAQAGIVGLKSRDPFVDGGFTLTRPVFRQFSAGFGVWGGAQPGLYRVDAGPRLTMTVRRNVKVHLDWRQRVAGNAQPGSGPALTLSGNF